MATIIKTNEKPILFSTPLVQAILEGRKTQTRRVIKPQPEMFGNWSKEYPEPKPEPLSTGILWSAKVNGEWEVIKSPYGKPGDELWVRETWRPVGWRCDEAYWKIEYKAGGEAEFHDLIYSVEDSYKERDLHIRLADELMEKGAPEIAPIISELGGWNEETIKEYLAWKPSIHMPRGASRIQLTVTDIRVEKVQDITDEDVKAEGIDLPFPDKSHFAELWDSINADRGYSWESNPYVWVISFKVKEVKGGSL